MRRIFLSLLALLVLSGCGAPAGQEAEEPPFPPETGPAGAVSAPAVVTEGRAPAEDYDLPTVPAVSQTDLLRDQVHEADSGVIELLAELPEADAAFYGLPSPGDVRKTALIRWGESLAEFDWDFAAYLGWPQLFCFDFDGDGEDELVLTCCADSDSSNSTSVYDLHVVEKNADGTLTDCALPESLWREQPLELVTLAHSGDSRAWVHLGREMVEFSIYGVPKGNGSLCMGRMVDYAFTYYNRTHALVYLQGWFCLDLGNGDIPKCAAGYSARVSYWDKTFMLSEMHLYGNY